MSQVFGVCGGAANSSLLLHLIQEENMYIRMFCIHALPLHLLFPDSPYFMEVGLILVRLALTPFIPLYPHEKIYSHASSKFY